VDGLNIGLAIRAYGLATRPLQGRVLPFDTAAAVAYADLFNTPAYTMISGITAGADPAVGTLLCPDASRS
jgi:hypothetical protein